jgi:hypothetical protein
MKTISFFLPAVANAQALQNVYPGMESGVRVFRGSMLYRGAYVDLYRNDKITEGEFLAQVAFERQDDEDKFINKLVQSDIEYIIQ